MDPLIARVVRAEVADWSRVRAIRLRALADAPDAFGMTLDEELARSEASWRERLADPAIATFLAVRGAGDVGLVVGGRWDGEPEDAGLYAMWVAPDQRGTGLGGALVDAVVGWARGLGRRRLLLDVADANRDAIRLYASRGFRPTGVVGSLPPPREHVPEHQRALVLRA